MLFPAHSCRLSFCPWTFPWPSIWTFPWFIWPSFSTFVCHHHLENQTRTNPLMVLVAFSFLTSCLLLVSWTFSIYSLRAALII